MSVVTNTGPLIGLAKIEQLSLLEQLFGSVHIPPAVHRELMAKSGPEADHLDAALARFIQLAPAPQLPPEVKIATLRLDLGEQQAIALAYELKMLLIIDDRLGRVAAQWLNLAVTGLVGVLIQGKEAGLIPTMSPMLEEIRRQGYWLSDQLIDIAKKLAGES